MVDLDWLMMNYEVTRTKDRPLVILYGAENPELASSDLQVTLSSHWSMLSLTNSIPLRYPFLSNTSSLLIGQYS